MELINKELFDTNASSYVLSCLMRNPLLLQDEKYAITKTDFFKPLQQIVYYSIFNMAQRGVRTITPQDVDLEIQQYSAQYEYYKKNKGYEFVLQCYQIAEGSDEHQFDTYYERLKKFSVLRDLESIGIDTKGFYDGSNIQNLEEESKKLNSLTLSEITNVIRAKLVSIDNKHLGKEEGTQQNAATGLRALVENLKKNPEVGLPLDGDIINYAARGARLGKLYTYSAPSGAGKTRYMVGNACAISMPYINKNGKIMYRGSIEEPNYQKVLYVATEQQPDEIQTMILAYVSGVNEKTILLGNYSPEELDRVEMAIGIIEKYKDNFIIECVPDPSIAMIKSLLAKYIVQEQVIYIFYDYIFTSPGLLNEFKDSATREDVVLMMLSNSIKETAMSYNVFIQSATQLNDGWSKKEVGLRDQNCIRGSKAIADKIDIGMIGIRIPEEEMKAIKPLWEELKKSNPQKYVHEPNVVVDIYKNRRGELNCVKVFRYFDYGTCHCEDLFVTDASYQAIRDIGMLKYDIRPFDYLDLKTRGTL